VNEAARPATNDDVNRIAELARIAIAELAATKGGTVWARREGRNEPVEESIRAEIADDAALTLVGTIDDVVVGYAIAIVEVLPDEGRLARLTDLYVEPDGREVGVGELLLDRVLAWATEARCFGIDSIALPGNRETKNFFESAGMVARAIIVHRSLP